MVCPYCKSTNTIVKDSRFSKRTNSMRRRRECFNCKNRFTSYEVVDSSIETFKEEIKTEILEKVLEEIDFKAIISESILKVFSEYKL